MLLKKLMVTLVYYKMVPKKIINNYFKRGKQLDAN